MSSSTPIMRCAVATTATSRYLLLQKPKAAPVELEPLMFFDAPASPSPPKPSADAFAVGAKWAHGATTIMLEVTSSGEWQRVNGVSEVATFEDARRALPSAVVDYQEYPAFFGCFVVDKMYLLVASLASVAVTLPYGGRIWKVKETRWVEFELPGVPAVALSTSDRNRLKEFRDYSHFKGYYFSDDVDVRLPFPFVSKGAIPSPNFFCDWSQQLRSYFCSSSGLGEDVCAVLVRGFAGEQKIRLSGGWVLHMALLGRQNQLNPGPRYIGRGLNAHHAAGNDHYYEFIMWKEEELGNSSSSRATSYCRFSFLRGTIPVHWTTKSSGVSFSEPAMVFSPVKEQVIEGSAEYFTEVFTELHRLMLQDSNGRTTNHPQLRCISLLRQTTSERTLASYYVDAIGYAAPRVKQVFPAASLDLAHVDWLNVIKDYNIDVATSAFFDKSTPFLVTSSTPEDSMITVGLLRPGEPVDNLLAQDRFVRVNCADSLDRTNVCSYLMCLQAAIAMLNILQIPFSSFPQSPPLPPLDPQEMRDPNTRSGGPSAEVIQQQIAQRSKVPPPFLNSWPEARDPNKMPPEVARAMAALFVLNGDCVAMLYTNSAAMHGNILRGVCGMPSSAHNALIATQRMYENNFEDGKKFRSIELLLGRDKLVHFPSLNPVFDLRPLNRASWHRALVIQSIPSSATKDDIDREVRRVWDAKVFPQLASMGETPVVSQSLRFSVTYREGLSEANQMSPTTSRYIDATGYNMPTEKPDGASGLAVLEFDSDLCNLLNVPSLLCTYGGGNVQILGRRCQLSPYAFPVQSLDDNGGVGDAVKQVGTSLKKGLKNFMRNLN